MKKRPGRARRGTRVQQLMSLRTGLPLTPVASMSAAELHRELVDDAVAGVSGGERYLKRQVDAYIRIAKLRGVNPDVAFEAVVAEVNAAGRNMPVL